MRHKPTSIAVILLFLVGLNAGYAQSVSIYGTVINSDGQPVPGITVSLVHPTFGRSAISWTGERGRYTIYGVSVHPAPYYIEAYWGDRLIYRAAVQVNGSLAWDITLN